MKKVISNVSFVIMCCLMLIPVYVLAQDNADSISVIGKHMFRLFQRFELEGSAEIYTTIIGIVGYFLTRLITFGLKSIKTSWYWNPITQKYAVSIFWRIAASLFGKSILLYKPDFKVAGSKTDAAAQMAKIDIIKNHLKKHDPLLSIEIK